MRAILRALCPRKVKGTTMNQLTNYLPTDELQRRNAAHHMQPFSAQDELSAQGARVITSAKGVYITDSDGNQYLDAMAGLSHPRSQATNPTNDKADFYPRLSSSIECIDHVCINQGV